MRAMQASFKEEELLVPNEFVHGGVENDRTKLSAEDDIRKKAVATLDLCEGEARKEPDEHKGDIKDTLADGAEGSCKCSVQDRRKNEGEESSEVRKHSEGEESMVMLGFCERQQRDTPVQRLMDFAGPCGSEHFAMMRTFILRQGVNGNRTTLLEQGKRDPDSCGNCPSPPAVSQYFQQGGAFRACPCSTSLRTDIVGVPIRALETVNLRFASCRGLGPLNLMITL
ncbi:unnamed protein product [Toxocara canis]|uniref:Uncharacterized protein n=1 Tax=Toxocara canis TaxID=6265 RepID=A0A183TXC3_TOXCA|nr:unnamed protein product [Toxocara canis]